MKYKLYIFVPDDEKIIRAIIDAASQAGAGVIENYSHTAFIQKGQGTWFAEVGSHPAIGKVGETTTINEAKIEMECPVEVAQAVKKAIAQVHPYEEPGIEFLKMEEI